MLCCIELQTRRIGVTQRVNCSVIQFAWIHSDKTRNSSLDLRPDGYNRCLSTLNKWSSRWRKKAVPYRRTNNFPRISACNTSVDDDGGARRKQERTNSHPRIARCLSPIRSTPPNCVGITRASTRNSLRDAGRFRGRVCGRFNEETWSRIRAKGNQAALFFSPDFVHPESYIVISIPHHRLDRTFKDSGWCLIIRLKALTFAIRSVN